MEALVIMIFFLIASIMNIFEVISLDTYMIILFLNFIIAIQFKTLEYYKKK